MHANSAAGTRALTLPPGFDGRLRTRDMSKSLSELYEPTAQVEGEKPTGVPAETVEAKVEPQKATADEAANSQHGEVPPASQTQPRDKTVPLAAHEDERRKRQEVERKLDEVTKRLASLEGQRRQQDEQPQQIDPLVDPEGFMTEINYARFQDRLRLSEDLVREKVGPDQYATAEQAVLRAASHDQRFYQWFGQRLLQEANPARFTYETGRQLLEAIDRSDPEKARQKFKEELRAELMAELGLSHAPSSQAAPAPTGPRVPTSLAGTQSVGPRTPGGKPIRRRSLSELYG